MQIINWLRANSIMVELFLVVLIIAGVILMKYVPESEQVVVLLGMGLAGFYFLSSFFVPDEEMPLLFTTIGTKIINISSAVGVVGLVFVLTGGEGAIEMLAIGLLSLVTATLLLLYFMATAKSSKFFPLLIRVVVLIAIIGYKFFELYKTESL